MGKEIAIKINVGSPKSNLEETKMATIKVKAVEGRVAYDAPRNGRKIPSDQFMSVRDTTYIRRLIEHHGDLIEEGGTTPTDPNAPILTPHAKPGPTAARAPAPQPGPNPAAPVAKPTLSAQ